MTDVGDYSREAVLALAEHRVCIEVWMEAAGDKGRDPDERKRARRYLGIAFGVEAEPGVDS